MTSREVVLRVGEHILEGPEIVTPIIGPPGEYATKYATLRQAAAGSDPVESLAIYAPPAELLPCELLPLVRRASWSKLRDMQQARLGTLTWPSIEVAYVSFETPDLFRIDEHLRRLDEALSVMKIDIEGLSYLRTHRESPLNTASRQPWYFRHLERMTASFAISVDFSNLEDTNLNIAWQNLWDALRSISERSIAIDCKETFQVDPKRYATLWE